MVVPRAGKLLLRCFCATDRDCGLQVGGRQCGFGGDISGGGNGRRRQSRADRTKGRRNAEAGFCGPAVDRRADRTRQRSGACHQRSGHRLATGSPADLLDAGRDVDFQDRRYRRGHAVRFLCSAFARQAQDEAQIPAQAGDPARPAGCAVFAQADDGAQRPFRPQAFRQRIEQGGDPAPLRHFE